MNKYIKPAFMVTSLTSGPLVGANCSIKKQDKDLIQAVLDIPGSFASSEEACKGFPVDMNSFSEFYCKFTSGELGASQALFS